MRRTFLLTALVTIFFAPLPAHCQDTRHVTEPRFPATCTTLKANLAILPNNTPSSETAFDTTRIQSALNSCSKGKAVELAATPTNAAFLSQPLDIPSGVTLLIDGGVTLFASRDPADYQRAATLTRAHCGTIEAKDLSPNGCRPFFTVNHGAPSSGAGIMGYGIINGRGNEKVIVNGVVQSYSWHDMIRADYKPGTNQQIGNHNNPKLFVSEQASNFTFYKITIYNSPGFSLQWEGPADGWTVWDTKVINTASAANTDGIEPVKHYRDVTIRDSWVSTGDDNLALDANGPDPVGNVTVSNLHTFAGDGLSLNGNLLGGESNILFDHVYMSGVPGHYAFDQEGPDIKTTTKNGGPINNITFQNFCLQNQLHPFRFVVPASKDGNNPHIPTFTNVTLRNVTVLPDSNGDGRSGMVEIRGFDAQHIGSVNLDNVQILGKLDPPKGAPQFVTLNIGPGPVKPESLLKFTGPGVTYTGKITNPTEAPFPCSAADFPSIIGELYLTGTMLNAVVESPTFEAPALTQPVTFFEDGKPIGTAPLGSNGTLATLAIHPKGPHTYTARYADTNFGSVTTTIK